MKKIVLIITVMCAVPLWSMNKEVIPSGRSQTETSGCCKVSRSIGALICCLPLTAVSCINDHLEPVRFCLGITTYDPAPKPFHYSCNPCSMTSDTTEKACAIICCNEMK